MTSAYLEVENNGGACLLATQVLNPMRRDFEVGGSMS